MAIEDDENRILKCEGDKYTLKDFKLNTYHQVIMESSKTDIYGNVDGLSLQNLYYARYGFFPNCYLFQNDNRKSENMFDTKSMLKYLIENADKDEDMQVVRYYMDIMGGETERNNLGFCVILQKSRIYARFEKDPSECYILFDHEHQKELLEFVNLVKTFYVEPKRKDNCFWRICLSNGSFYLTEGHINYPETFSVDMEYNDDFKHEDEKIRSFIEKPSKGGLVILHGEKGTGKSTYIKHLVHTYPDQKFVYVPSNLVGFMGDPSFGSFLTTLNNSTIVLEDCENVIRDRKQADSAYSVSTLLNLTDGILSDDLNLKFICTFNDDMKNIDSALLRKGRLVSKYEFKPLSVEKSNALLKYIGINDTVTKPMTVADIFNYEEDDYNKSEEKHIGFGR